MTETESQLASEKAAGYFGEGYHCAEAIVAAFLESIGDDPGEAIAHATAFGGGFGRTFADTCGVLSGSMIAIGHVCGRRQRGDNWDRPAEFGAAVRQQFIDSYGTSNCGVLRERFGEEQQMIECRKLVRDGVLVLLKLYRDRIEPQDHGETTRQEFGVASE
jgi:C_GCAxxG_C_C family probable redox protein